MCLNNAHIKIYKPLQKLLLKKVITESLSKWYDETSLILSYDYIIITHISLKVCKTNNISDKIVTELFDKQSLKLAHNCLITTKSNVSPIYIVAYIQICEKVVKLAMYHRVLP